MLKIYLNGGTGTLGTAAGRTTATVALFPNPAHGAVTIAGATPHAPLTVLDAGGRMLLAAATDASGMARRPLEGLQAGMYLVRSGEQVRRLAAE